MPVENINCNEEPAEEGKRQKNYGYHSEKFHLYIRRFAGMQAIDWPKESERVACSRTNPFNTVMKMMRNL
jgi:hypothetical protein